MSKRQSAEATKEPTEAEPKAKRAEGLNGAGPFIPADYEKPRHFTRIISLFGGPWPENVVAVSVADAELSRVLAQGNDLLLARSRGITTDGIVMTWLMAKPKGHAGQGFKEIRHLIRTIRGNLGAEPPALTTQSADALLGGLMAEGWRLFSPEVVHVDGAGQSILWVLVR